MTDPSDLSDLLGNLKMPRRAAKPTESTAPGVMTTKQYREALMGSTASDFSELAILGVGSFGRVRLVKHKRTGLYAAMKELSKSHVLKTAQLEHVVAERNILWAMDYHLVPALYASFQDEKYLYLILEFVPGGEFYSHLANKKWLTEEECKFYTACVFLGLEYMHNHHIIYRDLKPENLLMDARGYLKITDFGFAKFLPPGERTFTVCGTPEYLSPEIIQSRGHTGAADWWCLGILIYEMFAGFPPFESENRMELYEMIIHKRPKFPADFPPLVKDLVSQLLQVDLSKRLGNLAGGSKDISNHPWFADFDWAALRAGRMKAPFVHKFSGPTDVSAFEGAEDLEAEHDHSALSREEAAQFAIFDRIQPIAGLS